MRKMRTEVDRRRRVLSSPLRPCGPLSPLPRAARTRASGEGVGLRCLLVLALMLVAATAAFAQEMEFFPVGLHIQSLNELAKIGPEVKAAGFNCVLADGPLGAAAIPGLWQAQKLRLRVYLSADALGTPTSDPEATREQMLKIYDITSYANDNPAYEGFWLNIDGLREEQAAAFAAAGNAHDLMGMGKWVTGATARHGDVFGENMGVLFFYKARVEAPWEASPDMASRVLFKEPPPGETKDKLLAVLSAQAKWSYQGLFVTNPSDPATRQALFEAVKALPAALTTPMPERIGLPILGPSREEA